MPKPTQMIPGQLMAAKYGGGLGGGVSTPNVGRKPPTPIGSGFIPPGMGGINPGEGLGGSLGGPVAGPMIDPASGMVGGNMGRTPPPMGRIPPPSPAGPYGGIMGGQGMKKPMNSTVPPPMRNGGLGGAAPRPAQGRMMRGMRGRGGMSMF